MPNLERFDPAAGCPKCGAGGPHDGPTVGYNFEDDTLTLNCQVCKYEWTVKPLDAEPPQHAITQRIGQHVCDLLGIAPSEVVDVLGIEAGAPDDVEVMVAVDGRKPVGLKVRVAG